MTVILRRSPRLRPRAIARHLATSVLVTFATDRLVSASLVILSACNTASGGGRSDEGSSGLTRPFLYAGARSILVSHWPVVPEASAELTGRLAEEMAARPEAGAQAL